MHATTAAACVTVNACPATMIVPLRALPGFGATLNVTAPLPEPLPPAAASDAAGGLIA